jgi:polyphenol oxidase
MKHADNRAKVLAQAGLAALPAFMLKQVHGCAVHNLKNADQPVDGDGWIVDTPGRVALVYAADCTPIFIWDRRGKSAAVLHSGWKGTKANIAGEAVKRLAGLGIKAADLEAYLGGHIGPCCYSVGEDFTQWARPKSLERRAGKLYFDLAAEAGAQLVEAGLSSANIMSDAACTACSGEFFSFRREKQGTRMIGFLALSHGL